MYIKKTNWMIWYRHANVKCTNGKCYISLLEHKQILYMSAFKLLHVCKLFRYISWGLRKNKKHLVQNR